MMRLFCLYAFLLWHACATAQNNVRLVCSNGSLFKVYFHDKPVNKNMQASVLIEHTAEDTLYLKVEFENSSKYGVSVFLLEKQLPVSNKEFVYSIAQNKNKITVSYLDSYELVPLPDPIVPKVTAADTSTKHTLPVHFCELRDGKPVYFNNLPKEGACTTPMPPEFLSYAQQLIKKSRSPDEKYAIVENTGRNNCLSVEQLNTLLSGLDYEIEKLKLVRLVYYNLTDVQNRKDLEKSFRLTVSVNELNTFFDHAGDFKTHRVDACLSPSPEEDIRKLSENLAAFMGDAQRLEVLKRIYTNYCYSAGQVIFILQKFTHDREKLEASKLLYFNCVEKNNFQKVTEIFSYPQAAGDLKDFLEKQAR